MKQLFKLSIILIVASIFFLSCQKDKENEPQFDIKNPVGYVIAGKFDLTVESNQVQIPIVFEFLPNQKIRIGYIEGTGELDYLVSNDTILLDGMKLLIKKDRVTHFTFGIQESPNNTFKLLKKPETRLLLGKTYTGTYFNPDGTVLHPNFFYSFHAADDKIDAGYNVGTTVRTETYTNISNIAALVPGNGFREFMLLDEGKLEVMYMSNTGTLNFGTLNPQ